MPLTNEEIRAKYEEGIEYYKLNPPRRGGKFIPYVLFGAVQKDLNKANQWQDVARVMMLPMSGSHGTKSTIDYYVMNKGFQVLTYWFPKLDQETMRRFHDGKNPYDEVVNHLYKLKNYSQNVVAAQKSEIDAMAQKIALLEGKVKK